MDEREKAQRLIVYDGICHMCSGWARFLSRRPLDPPFALVPVQSERGRALLIGHGIDPEDPATFLVLDRGMVLTDSNAVIHVVAALGGAWKVIYALRVIPLSWRDAGYRLLARNRYRWLGRRTTCYLPGSEDT